ncbi:unnamed protein product [Lupinus luteus]|uniref:Uncharacterized protein n=1 Tax=Lupinus luteus TaxID=3873 RepID=A0AAV1W1K3_LUPLU
MDLDFHQNYNSKMSTIAPQLLASKHCDYPIYHQDESFFIPKTSVDPYFDPTSFLYPETYPHVLPYKDLIISLSDIFPTEEDHCNNLIPCQKRRKCLYEEEEQSPNNNFIDSFVPNDPFQEEELLLPLPEQFFFDAIPNLQVPQLPEDNIIRA